MKLYNDPLKHYWTMRKYYPYSLELRDHLINDRPRIKWPRFYTRPVIWQLLTLLKPRKDDLIDYLNMYRKWTL